MSDKLTYSIREAVAALGISRATLYRLFKRGEIQTFKLGAKTLMLRTSLEAFVARAAAAGDGRRPMS